MQACKLPDFTIALHSKREACIHQKVHTQVLFVVKTLPLGGLCRHGWAMEGYVPDNLGVVDPHRKQHPGRNPVPFP